MHTIINKQLISIFWFVNLKHTSSPQFLPFPLLQILARVARTPQIYISFCSRTDTLGFPQAWIIIVMCTKARTKNMVDNMAENKDNIDTLCMGCDDGNWTMKREYVSRLKKQKHNKHHQANATSRQWSFSDVPSESTTSSSRWSTVGSAILTSTLRLATFLRFKKQSTLASLATSWLVCARRLGPRYGVCVFFVRVFRPNLIFFCRIVYRWRK